MKLRNIWSIFLFTSLLVPTSSWASSQPSLLIADIDDTLKISNSTDLLASAIRAFQINPVPGLRNILEEVTRTHSSLRVEYVSRAPREIMLVRHHEFLRLNDFPSGRIHQPSMFDRPGFKLRRIREILNRSNPGLVILLGDNSEMDAAIYSQIAEEFSDAGFEFQIFIRQAVSLEEERTAREVLSPDITWFSGSHELRAAMYASNLLEPSRCIQAFR